MAQRTAIEDANAGVVDVPSTREKMRGQGIAATARPKTDTTQQEFAIEAIDSFGNKLANFAAKKNEEERKRQALQGAMDQGEDTALNDIAALEKRTGLSEFLFGQSAYYEGAQRKAVENNLSRWYTKELVQAPDNAGMSPDQYAERLRNKFDSVYKSFEGDPETQLLVQENFEKISSKLNEAYTKQRHIYEQNQSFEVWQDTIAAETDVLNAEAANIGATPEEQQRRVEDWKNFYDYNRAVEYGKETGTIVPNEEKWRLAHTENIVAQLEAGNVNVYEGAEATGFLRDLPRTTQATIQAAKEQYDRRRNNSAYTAKSKLWRDAETITSEDQIPEYLEMYKMHQVDDDRVFPASEIGKFEDHMWNALAKHELDRDKANKAVDTLEKNVALAAAGVHLHRYRDIDPTRAQNTSAVVATLNNKARDYADAMDMDMRINDKDVVDMGTYDTDPMEYVVRLQTDPAAADNASKRLNSKNEITDIDKAFIETSTDDLLNAMQLSNGTPLRDEDGLSPQGQLLMNNLYTYEKNQPGVLAKALTKEKYMQLQVFKHLLRNGSDMKTIRTSLDNLYNPNFSYKLPKEGKPDTLVSASKADWLQAKARSMLEGSRELTNRELDMAIGLFDTYGALIGDRDNALKATIQAIQAEHVVTDIGIIKHGDSLDRELREWVNTEKTVAPDLTSAIYGAEKLELQRGSVAELLQFGEAHGYLNSQFALLGIKKNDRGLYDPEVLYRHKINYEVEEGTNNLVMSIPTSVGTRTTSVPVSMLKSLLRERSNVLYVQKERAAKEAQIKRAQKTQQNTRTALHTRRMGLR